MESLKCYLPLCWFSGNPLELPRTPRFYRQNLLVYCIAVYFLQANLTDDPFESFYEVALQVLLMLGVISVALLVNKTLYAYYQITTAILFCANVSSILLVPIIIWITMTEDPLSYYAMSLIILWYFSLVSYIIKQVGTLDSVASVLLSFLYFTLTYLGAFGIAQLI
jgi:hypothetical protein